MPDIIIETKANVPVAKLFDVWDKEYADIYKFHTGLSESYVLEDSPEERGLGALRHCAMSDGKNWIREKVIKREENTLLVFDVYEFTFPMKWMQVIIDFQSLEADQSHLRFTFQFEPKMGLLGKMMAPLMKMKFKPVLQGMIDNSAKYAETGIPFNDMQKIT